MNLDDIFKPNESVNIALVKIIYVNIKEISVNIKETDKQHGCPPGFQSKLPGCILVNHGTWQKSFLEMDLKILLFWLSM